MPISKKGCFGLSSGVFAAAALAIAALSPTGASAKDIVLKVAYASDFEPVTPQMGKTWWDSVIQAFQKVHPNVQVQLEPVPGDFSDSESKIALLFRSRRSAPDVVGLADLNMGQWASTGYLLPLDKYLPKAAWWAGFNPQIRADETINGHVYAVSEGMNVYGLLYDKTLFAKAGIPTPWVPKTWADIIDAAKKLKASSSTIYPLWVQTGTSQGTFGVFAGPGDFIAASSDPTILTKDGKWVVDSKGLRETIQFYKDAAQAGVLAPSSQIMDAMAESTPLLDMPKHMIGICLGGNWYPELWTKADAQPYWPGAVDSIGVAPLPTVNGAAPGTGTMIGGWTLAIGSGTKYPDLAWDLIDIAQQRKYMLTADIAVALLPPVTAYTHNPDYLNFAPPFRAAFVNISKNAEMAPLDPNYSVWGQGLLTATQAVVLDPTLSVDDAIGKMKDVISNQVGPDAGAVRN
jgi:multiple sugar transport system substrate-binding protein